MSIITEQQQRLIVQHPRPAISGELSKMAKEKGGWMDLQVCKKEKKKLVSRRRILYRFLRSLVPFARWVVFSGLTQPGGKCPF